MNENEQVVKIPLPKLHSGQLEARKQFKRFTVLAIGRRFGKTFMALNLICTRAIEGKRCAYIAPNYSMTTKFFKNCAKRLAPIVKSINSKDYLIELVTDGSIQMFSFASINTIRGNDFDFVVIDEAAFCDNLKDEWDNAIRSVLIDRQGEALFLSTPNGFNDFYTLFEKSKKDKQWASVQMSSHKNPFIPPQELIDVKESLPSDAYDREILAQFNDSTASIFKRDWIQRVDQVPEDLVISFGVDLAISSKTSGDFTVISVLGHHVQTNNYYILAVYRSKLSFNQIIMRIQEMADIWKPTVIAIESVAFQRVVSDTLLETTTLPIVSVHPTVDKVSRAMPLATRFEKGQVFVHDTPAIDPELYVELLAFPNKNVHDDTVDSVEMAFSALSQTTPFVFSI